jgi:predicted N-acyltransferase
LPLRWSSFEDYLADLRSHYRRRYRKALRASAGLRMRFLADPSEFD